MSLRLGVSLRIVHKIRIYSCPCVHLTEVPYISCIQSIKQYIKLQGQSHFWIFRLHDSVPGFQRYLKSWSEPDSVRWQTTVDLVSKFHAKCALKLLNSLMVVSRRYSGAEPVKGIPTSVWGIYAWSLGVLSDDRWSLLMTGVPCSPVDLMYIQIGSTSPRLSTRIAPYIYNEGHSLHHRSHSPPSSSSSSYSQAYLRHKSPGLKCTRRWHIQQYPFC